MAMTGWRVTETRAWVPAFAGMTGGGDVSRYVPFGLPTPAGWKLPCWHLCTLSQVFAIIISKPLGSSTLRRRLERKWLSGRAPPCQGGGREFKSRLPLHFCALISWPELHLKSRHHAGSLTGELVCRAADSDGFTAPPPSAARWWVGTAIRRPPVSPPAARS